MFRKLWMVLPLLAVSAASAQDRRSRIDVQHYNLEAEVNPRTQSLSA